MDDLILKIELQIINQSQEQEEVQELDIQDVKIIELPKQISDKFSKLQKLSNLGMTNCGLCTLKGFPIIPSLNVLILESNNLSGESLIDIPQLFQNLYCLSLSDNKINTLEEVSVLNQLEQLKQLDLSDNSVSALPNYQKDVFNLITTLEVLDNKDRNGNEIQYSNESLGSFTSSQDEENNDSEESEEDSPIKKIKR